jgi:hypothetical protein
MIAEIFGLVGIAGATALWAVVRVEKRKAPDGPQGRGYSND